MSGLRLAHRPCRATGVPEFRAELVDIASDGTLDEMSRFNSQWTYEPDRRMWLSGASVQLRASSLWWIGGDVVDLASEVAGELPDETTITDELLGAPFGLMVFEKPFRSFSADAPDEPLDVVALWWAPMLSATHGQSILLGVWVDLDGRLPDGYAGGTVSYLGGTRWDVDDGDTVGALTSDVAVDWRMLISVLSLSRSPGITTTDQPKPDRAARRRLGRAEMPTEAPRVIYLNRRQGGDGSGESSTYHHRWIVRGHWRSQPYGPQRAYRRPVFIAPHVKGPAGAPMLTGDKVHAFTSTP